MNSENFSRRGWILRVGGASILTEIGAAGLGATESLPLPPGLYEPSLQHLAHSLRTNVGPIREQVSPRYFGARDLSLVRTLVGLILGEEPSAPIVLEIAGWIDMIVGRSEEVRAAARSLSPAHRRLALDYYGEETVRELESQAPQAICREGLAAIKRAGFEGLDSATQLSYLVNLEKTRDPFVMWIKQRTLDGFYTSRLGLQELDYKGNAFLAQSPGCDHQNTNP